MMDIKNLVALKKRYLKRLKDLRKIIKDNSFSKKPASKLIIEKEITVLKSVTHDLQALIKKEKEE